MELNNEQRSELRASLLEIMNEINDIPELMINAQQACTVLGISAPTLKEWTRRRVIVDHGTSSPQYRLREVCSLRTKSVKYIRFKEMNGVR